MFAALTGWLETRAAAKGLLFRVKSGSRANNLSILNGEDKGSWSHTYLDSYLGSATDHLLNLSLSLSFLICKIGIMNNRPISWGCKD